MTVSKLVRATFTEVKDYKVKMPPFTLSVNAHEVKLVRLIQSLCAVCGSNLAVLNPSVYNFCCVAPCVQRMLVLIVQFVINQINEDYFFKILYTDVLRMCCRKAKIVRTLGSRRHRFTLNMTVV